MKKIVGILAAAALASSAFAEINVSSWGRMDVIPLNFTSGDDNVVKSLAGANWDGNNTGKQLGKDGVSFSGSTENAGMALDIAFNSSGLGVGDNANLWVKPVDMLKLTFGQVDYNNGRQDFAYGTFGHTYRLQGMDVGEGLAVSGRGVTGFVVNLNPIDNLWFDYAASVKNDEAYKTLWDGASFGVGYNIPDVAKIRAVLIGHDGDGLKNEKNENLGAYATIQAAVDLTPVEGLFLTAGVSVPTTFGKAYKTTKVNAVTAYKVDDDSSTPDTVTYTATGSKNKWGQDLYTKNTTTGTTYYVRDAANDVAASTSISQETLRASLGASYKVSVLTFNALFDAKFGVISGQEKTNAVTNEAGKIENNGFGYLAGFGVDVAFTDSLSLITDFRFTNGAYQGFAAKDTSLVDDSWTAIYNRGKFGGYVGLCQALTNGTFDVGVEFGVNKAVVQASDNGFTVAIPLQIQVGL